MLKYISSILLFLQFVSIVFTVEATILRIDDCVPEEGVVTLYPLGSLSEDDPENPLMLLKEVRVKGAM